MEISILPLDNLVFNNKDKELCYFVSKERQEKIKYLKNDKAKKLCLYSALLSRMMLSQHTNIKNNELFFTKNKYGKPLFYSPDDSVHFNFSHSRDVIIFTLSYHEIGVDIEKPRPYNMALVNKVLHEEEKDYYFSLNTDLEKDRFFFRIWTIKEAYAKYQGTGINFDLKELNCLASNIQKNLHTNEYNDYIFSVYSLDEHYTNPTIIKEADIHVFFSNEK